MPLGMHFRSAHPAGHPAGHPASPSAGHSSSGLHGHGSVSASQVNGAASASHGIDSASTIRQTSSLTFGRTRDDNFFSYAQELQHINQESGRYLTKPEPWVQEDGTVKSNWSELRINVFRVMRSQQLEWAMAAIIIFNLLLIIYETDEEAKCYPEYDGNLQECPTSGANQPVLQLINLILLIVYTLEALIRVFAQHASFFVQGWNLLDFVIVFLGWTSELLGAFISIEQVAWLRVLRIGRLLRAMRIFVSIKELHMLLTGLIGSMKAIVFGSLMLMAMLILSSILMVQYVHPINSRINYSGCDRCAKGYCSVMESTLTLFQQIVAGDSWGTISIPVISKEPWTAIPLCVTLLTVGLGAMNLILAVIVDRAAEARESKGEILVQQKLSDQRQRRLELLEMFQAMDKDNSGTLSMNELESAWVEKNSRFREMMSVLDLHKGDLKEIFETIDNNNNGEINYLDFCNNLDQMQSKDIRFLATLTKLRVCQTKGIIEKDLARNKKTLLRHDRVLEYVVDIMHSIDRKVSRLVNEKSAARSKSHDLFDTKTNDRLDAILEAEVGKRQKFALLERQVMGLDEQQNSILRKAQEHAELLLEQRDFVCDMRESVEDYTGKADASSFGKDLQEQLDTLLTEMEKSLKKVVEEIDEKLQKEADMLVSNAARLNSIGNLLPGSISRKKLLRHSTSNLSTTEAPANKWPRADETPTTEAGNISHQNTDSPTRSFGGPRPNEAQLVQPPRKIEAETMESQLINEVSDLDWITKGTLGAVCRPPEEQIPPSCDPKDQRNRNPVKSLIGETSSHEFSVAVV